MSTSLHDTDLVAWAQQSAALLREGAELSEEEREQIADELYDMAASTRRELKRRGSLLLMHLLKQRFQPEKRTRSWDITIGQQRNEVEAILDESPSLRRLFEQELPKIYTRAKRDAELETGRNDFPEDNPFTLESILNG